MKRIEIVIIFSIFCIFFDGCHDPLQENIPLILCISDAEIKSTKTINDYSCTNEGITIKIYELSDITVEKFINTTKTLPINKEDTTWVNFGWYVTPIDSFYKGVFDHLNYMSPTNVEKTLKTIKNELNENNTFYAFYIRKFDETIEPLEVQIFVLNPVKKKLYIIISIT
jgi:hypothetical protein